MRKKIVILGSTSSIGKSLLNIIKKDKKNFKIELLTANTNYKDLINQAKKFNVKNIIITDPDSFKKTKTICKKKDINIFQNFECLKRILPKKVDYVMSAISGIGGLLPTYKIINRTKLIAIANKEAIVCGWPLIKSELKKNKTSFIPVDSEHFSIFSLIENKETNDIEKIYITASGGPFLNLAKNKFKKIKLSDALKHPNWRMGKKITIDSATLVNKVIEVIEASILFNLNLKQIDIFIHPASLIHGIVNFVDGSSHLVASSPDMKVPISFALSWPDRYVNQVKFIDFIKNKDLNFIKPDYKKFPALSLKKLVSNSIFAKSTIIVLNAANEIAVDNFLKKNIKFDDIVETIKKTIYKFDHNEVKTLEDIMYVDCEARLLTNKIIKKNK